jgi:hypothetical protein
MKFRVAGPHLYYDQFDLYGDVMSLYGKGEMDLDRNIRLTFHSQIGPGQLQLPVWRRLVGEASQQIMQIHVDGTLDQPRITNQMLPAVNEALQQLQVDLQPGAPRRVVPNANRPLPQVR